MRKILWGVAAMLCLTFCPISVSAMTEAEARAAAERLAMLHDKELAGSLSEYKRLFPDEYEKTIDAMASEFLKGTEHDAILAGRQYLIKAAYTHLGDIANAPDEALVKLGQSQENLFAILSKVRPSLLPPSKRADP